MQGINEVVNRIYGGIEKDDDKEDYQFSILKMGLVIWRYRVFKRAQKQILKATESSVRQFFRLIKIQMMKSNRSINHKKEESSSDDDSSDSDDSSSDEEKHEKPVIQVGHLKVQY